MGLSVGLLVGAMIGNLTIPAELEGLVAALAQARVQVAIAEQCPPQMKGWYVAEGLDRRLILCPNNFRRETDLRDTLSHEAVHGAQFCARGLLFSPQERQAMLEQLPQRQRQSLLLYPAREIAREIEARALEEQPSQVATLVARHCHRMMPPVLPTPLPGVRPSSPAGSGP